MPPCETIELRGDFPEGIQSKAEWVPTKSLEGIFWLESLSFAGGWGRSDAEPG
jgi:hypothetical protein